MDGANKKYGKWHTVYVKFNKWPQNSTIAKAIAFFLFFKILILDVMKKQKLLNKENSILFIDSTTQHLVQYK